MPIKALTFKGDKKSKKRKHRSDDPSSKDPTTTTPSTNGLSVPADTDDETWVLPDSPTDLTGPILLILPTAPITCLATDANGTVFASIIENIVDGYAETAEPHDVRQVWVAGKVAGSKEVSFKGPHGGYLGCDSMGVLGARREARGIEEGFEVEHVEGENVREDEKESRNGDGEGEGQLRWRIKTAASIPASGDNKASPKYLCATQDTPFDPDPDPDSPQKKVSISLRGDGDSSSQSTHLTIKMQARFKPLLQATKESKANSKVSRQELEATVGRRLEDEEVRKLKRAKREGRYYEEVLDVRVKGRHDKFA